MNNWSINYNECKTCGKTNRKHAAKGYCTKCYYYTIDDKKREWYQKNKESLLKRLRRGYTTIKKEYIYINEWTGKTNNQYNGIQFRCSGCDLKCLINSPFNDIIRNGYRYNKFKEQLLIECTKKLEKE